jgi:hypothetical protein
LAVAGDSIAIHVAGECDVAPLGQASGAPFGVIVEARASVDYHCAWASVGAGIVPDEDAGQTYFAIAVCNCSGVDFQGFLRKS